MILLDTNVLSEIMKSSPSQKVTEWFARQTSENLYISTITIAEITYGIQTLPKGKKRSSLQRTFETAYQKCFSHRIVSFDINAATRYGAIMSLRKNTGKPLTPFDGQIAAIADTNQAILATRNTKDFKYYDLELINPWDDL